MEINITTAIDSLVDLVKKHKKISLDDASKMLGIPVNILNEWAAFLEEENILEIEYKFTTPYLIEESGKEKLKVSKKELESHKELILRKLEYTLSNLESIKYPNGFNEEQIKRLLKDKSRLLHLPQIKLKYVRKYIVEKEINALIKKVKQLKAEDVKGLENVKEELIKIAKRKKVVEKAT